MCKTNVQYINSREIRFRSSHQRCSIKKVFLEISQISQESTCARVSFLIKLRASGNLINLFSCEFCEISKSTFFSVDTRPRFNVYKTSIRRRWRRVRLIDVETTSCVHWVYRTPLEDCFYRFDMFICRNRDYGYISSLVCDLPQNI